MNNVIGLNQTTQERAENWQAMQTFKATAREFKNHPDAAVRQLGKNDEGWYNKYLSEYVA